MQPLGGGPHSTNAGHTGALTPNMCFNHFEMVKELFLKMQHESAEIAGVSITTERPYRSIDFDWPRRSCRVWTVPTSVLTMSSQCP